ncbi:MAG: ATP-binding protein [Desulfobacteraceae bacterium]|nr:MAG: ATP-binding protein [Desulfobacteraceae bacterium]
MLSRRAIDTLHQLAKGFPIIAVTGPRQSGKTTLAQAAFPDKPSVSLEEPDKLRMAAEDTRGFLANYPDGAVIDEAQRLPELFSYLQGIVDRKKQNGMFILTGSQQFGLLSNITQSLAGRVGLVQLLPFSIRELQNNHIAMPSLPTALYRGLYPPLFDRELSPAQWYANYVMTYVERDVRNLINVRDLSTFQRFLRMTAGRVGQLLNLSSLANDCGISHNTAAGWLSVLEAGYIVFLLQPHFKNFGKRLVKTPKLYFYDTGLAAWLLNIQDPEHLSIHPQRGGLFESLIIADLLKSRFNRGLTSNFYFWRNNLGDEIDLLIDHGIDLVPVEIKSGETVPSDFSKTLNKWFKWSNPATPKGYLVYGGSDDYTTGPFSIVSWLSASQKLPL